MSDPIQSAVAAHDVLSTARDEYSRAVLGALDAGVSVSELAAALGVSRQAVNQMRQRAAAKPIPIRDVVVNPGAGLSRRFS